MGIEYVRKSRGMKFLKRGMRVHYVRDNEWGNITSTHGANLMIKMDGKNYSSNYHPYFMLDFYGKDGKLIYEHECKTKQG